MELFPSVIVCLLMTFFIFLNLRLPVLCQTPKCLHHKDLRQLAMTDTEYRVTISFLLIEKHIWLKGGQKGLKTNTDYEIE